MVIFSVGMLVAIALMGCASAKDVANHDAQAALYASLQPFEEEGVATIDLDEVVPGDWAEIVLVCRGANNAELVQTLGFDWSDAPDLESIGFANMFVFSTGSTVESSVLLGQDKFAGNDQYVNPCPLPTDGDRAMVAVLDRGDSAMTFRLDPSTFGAPMWIYQPR